MMAPKQFASRLTYPNPFTPTGIDFDLPQEALVTLEILDESGHALTELMSRRRFGAGTHHIDFSNGSGVLMINGTPANPHSVYFSRLSVEMDGKLRVDTKKIVFVK